MIITFQTELGALIMALETFLHGDRQVSAPVIPAVIPYHSYQQCYRYLRFVSSESVNTYESLPVPS